MRFFVILFALVYLNGTLCWAENKLQDRAHKMLEQQDYLKAASLYKAIISRQNPNYLSENDWRDRLTLAAIYRDLLDFDYFQI